MSIENPVCGECRHFCEVEPATREDSALGECRRYPPTIYAENEDEMQIQGRPLVWASESCGEFMQRLSS